MSTINLDEEYNNVSRETLLSNKKSITDLPAFNETQLALSDEFLSSFGFLGSTQINSLVINTLCVAPEVQNVEFYIDRENKIIDCVLLLGFWALLFYNKQKIIDKISHIYSESKCVSQYRVNFKFKRLKVKK